MNIIGKLTEQFQKVSKGFQAASTGEKVAMVAAGVGGVAGAAIIHPFIVGAVIGGAVGGVTPAIVKKVRQLGK